MKIGSVENKAAVAQTTNQRKTASGGGAVSGAEASAKVELSSGDLLTSSNEGVFDAEKVNRIANAIRDGKFEINPEAIADKLISNARELLSPGSTS
jgi:negative regulator of flagellin synthesis FlgM